MRRIIGILMLVVFGTIALATAPAFSATKHHRHHRHLRHVTHAVAKHHVAKVAVHKSAKRACTCKPGSRKAGACNCGGSGCTCKPVSAKGKAAKACPMCPGGCSNNPGTCTRSDAAKVRKGKG